MPNRVIKDAIYLSDKLAACRDEQPVALTTGDVAKLLYTWVGIVQQDDHGCFELNVPVLRIRCFGRFESMPSETLILRCLQLLNTAGLLFVWEEGGKLWAYVTGQEAGRLPEPSRRRKRGTPTLGHPAKKKSGELWQSCDWPEVQEYLATFKDLRPATDGLLKGFKAVRAASASPQSPTDSPQSATVSPQPPSDSPPSPSLARAGADQDHEHETGTGSNRDGTRPPRQSEVSKALRELAGSMGNNGSLRKKLEEGIYRNRLFASYDDYMIEQERRGAGKKLTEFVARGVLEEAVKLLLVSRGFRELGKVNSSQLADTAWPRVQKGLVHLADLTNYDVTKRQLGGHVINCVVNAALELQGSG